jgi:PAS domain S-box-containing protein
MGRLFANRVLVIASLYASFGTLWILLSDILLTVLLPDPASWSAWQTYKGWFFVAASTMLIFLLLARENQRHTRAQHDLALTEMHYRLLVEGVRDYAIIMLDPVGRVVTWNAGAAKINGYVSDEIIGQSMTLLYPTEDQHAGKPEHLLATAQAQGQMEDEGWRVRKDGSRYWASTVLTALYAPDGSHYGFAKITRDLTERLQAEARIHQLNRIYAVLSEVNQAIVRIREPQELFAAVCRIAVSEGGLRMAWVGLVDPQTNCVQPVAHAGVIDGYLENLHISLDDSPHGHGPSATALREGHHVVIDDIEHAPAMAPWRADALRLGYRASAAFPFALAGEMRGVINLYAAEPAFFDDVEVRLLDELAMDLAFGLEVAAQEAQKRLQAASLRESEERYRLLVNQSPYAIILHQDGKLVFANPAALQLFGAQCPEDLLGKPIQALVHPDGWEAAQARIMRMVHGELGLYPVEDRYIRLDGSVVPVEVSAAAFQYGGRPALQVIALDISRRRQAESSLWATERRLRMAVAAANVGLWDWDLRTNQIYYSPEWKRQIGYADDEIPNDLAQWRMRVHPDDLERAEQTVAAYLAAPWPDYHLEFRFRHKDGSYRSILTQADVLLDEQGRPTHMLGSHVDVTEQVRAQQERERLLAQLERRLKALTALHEAAQSMQVLRTTEALATEVIRILEATLEYEYGAVLLVEPETGRLQPFALSRQQRDEAFLAADRAYVAAHAPTIGQGITGWVAQTGQSVCLDDVRSDPRYYAMRPEIRSELCVPLRVDEQVIGVVNVETSQVGAFSAEDQTVLETVAGQIAVAFHNAQLYGQVREHATQLETRVAQRTAELQVAMQRAQEADHLKSAFLATMSHELRTPLNSIIGFTGVLLQGLAGPLNAEQTKQLGMTRDSARHLLALINDVLDLSKIEAGQLELMLEPFDLRDALEAVLRAVQAQAQQKGLDLTTVIGPGVGILVSDRRRVEQVLLNLVNNAIKFTEHGAVCVECSQQGNRLAIRVRDTGIGIKAEDLDKLFKPFQQVDTGLARRHEGTGLGLSICWNLVKLLGGEIGVTSEWGKGSTFAFWLPLNPQHIAAT